MIEPERQPRRPDLGRADLAQEVRQRADVVLVAVREHDRADPVAPLAEVAEVGQDEVDAEVLVAREREARVDDDDLVVRLEHGHVLADLAEAAERDDAAAVRRHCSLSVTRAPALDRPAGQAAGLRARARSRQPRICARSASSASTSGSRSAADLVAEQVRAPP